MRWYLCYGLSCRDLEELLAERGIEVDQVTLYRWVQRFTALLIEAARPSRHLAGDRGFVDETYVKVSGCTAVRVSGRGPTREVVDVYASRHRLGTRVLDRRPDLPRRTYRGDHRPGASLSERDREPDS